MPLWGGILARAIVNPVPLVMRRLSQLNTQPLLDSTGRPFQGEKIFKRSAPIAGERSDENSPKRRCVTYHFHAS